MRNSKELKEKLKSTIAELNDLEKHFRLQKIYLRRNQAIDKDFKKVLGSNCVRITHDAKNPLVIGLGGPDGMMTTQQKRMLGIAGCIGTMVEFADDDENIKEARRAFTVTLSSNTDKTSHATLQNLFFALKKSPIKEILSNKKITQLEVTHDNAPNYISKEFLYGATKTITKMFPNLELVRWAPLCPLHGRTHLDRRFSNLTTWQHDYQLNTRIGSIAHMKRVLES